MFDLLVKEAMVFDGTANPWFRADVAVEGDRIAKVGAVARSAADIVIDAKGLAVAPGFLDIHAHQDLVLMQDDHPEVLKPFVLQGVTTQVIGNCAYGAAPLTGQNLELIQGFLGLITGKPVPYTWKTMGEYLRRMQEQGVVYNVATLTAHAPIRFSVMGASDARPTSSQLTEMQGLLEQSLEEGSFGFSAGLLYPPGIWTPTEELTELCKVVGKYDGVFACHMRGSSETGVDAEREIIEIGEKAGVRVQHSHHEAFGKRFWPQVHTTLKLDEEARARGLDIASDIIPYTVANTTIRAIYPPWALVGGVPELVNRLKDPATRKKIKHDILNVIPKWPPWGPGGWPHNLVEATGWENIVIMFLRGEKNKPLIGKSIAQIASETGKDAFDVAFGLTIEENGDVMALYFGVSGDRQDDKMLQHLLKHPLSGIGPDAILLGRGMPHPAGYGTFPRVLGRYARDMRLFSMEEAVRKMTSFNASRIGITDRGLIREGLAADLVVFNPRTVVDKATYDNPMQYGEGIEYVVVNGDLLVEKGMMRDGLLPGRVLRRMVVDGAGRGS